MRGRADLIPNEGGGKVQLLISFKICHIPWYRCLSHEFSPPMCSTYPQHPVSSRCVFAYSLWPGSPFSSKLERTGKIRQRHIPVQRPLFTTACFAHNRTKLTDRRSRSPHHQPRLLPLQPSREAPPPSPASHRSESTGASAARVPRLGNDAGVAGSRRPDAEPPRSAA